MKIIILKKRHSLPQWLKQICQEGFDKMSSHKVQAETSMSQNDVSTPRVVNVVSTANA